MSREDRARALSRGGWSVIGSHTSLRYTQRKLDRRRGPRWCPHCPPDHKQQATHVGMANGVALTSGCEFHMAAWARRPPGSVPGATEGELA